MKKKREFLLCLVCLTLGWIQPATADLIGWWPFEDGSGTVAKDASENKVDGLVLGDAVWDKHGQHGDALMLDGDGDYVYVEGNYSLPLYSVGMWFRVDGGTAERDLLGIYADELVFGILLEVRSNGVLRYLHRSDAGTDINIYTDTAYDDGTWHHIAAVKSAEEMVLYMDGALVGSAANSTLLPDPMNNLVIGILDHGRNLRFFPGPIDEVFVYDHALSAQEVQAVMDSRGPGMGVERAGDLYPKDRSTDVLRDVVLEWSPGEFAATHDLYTGESFDDVNDATVPIAAGLDVNSFDLGRQGFGETVFWRVDEVNAAPDNTVFKGNVWSFEVEPYSIPIAGADIIATASSASNDFSTPQKTLDGSGLDANDMHAIAPETMWFTATNDLEPWIQYEFNAVKKLDTMTVWNSNSSAEGFIGYGVQGVLIEYSLDGDTWDVFEDVNEFSRAPGLPTYNQHDEIALGGIAAKMVRLAIQSNFGGFIASYSLSEVQFSMIPTAARTPVPESGSVDILPDAVLSWRAGRQAAQSTVYVSTDPNAVTDGLVASATSNTNSINLSVFDIELGATYYWRVDEVNNAEAVSVWAGPVWSLTTAATLIVDDFESYSNDSPDRPFQTWLDGFGYSADEFFPVGYGGNGTGAGVGHDIWTVASEHYNGDIMETAIVKSGSLSMPLYYNNATSTTISEATRSLTDPQNWTQAGIKGLKLSFQGDPDNTATTMYLKINGTQVDFTGDVASLQQKPWHTWYVDLANLAGVNLETVTELTIGFEGGKGVVYFDDIVLIPSDRQQVTPVEPSATDLVVQYAFEGNVADSAGANSGTAEGTPEFVAGKNGQAIKLDGMDDYVTVEGSFDLATYSASLWFRVEGGTGQRDIISMYDSAGAFGVLLELQANGSLRYLKRSLGMGTTGGTNIYTTSTFGDGAWYHVALVKSVDAITLYVNGESVGSQADTTAYDVGALHRITLGVLKHDDLIRYFPGDIDDFSLYSRALSRAEVMWLAGKTIPMD